MNATKRRRVAWIGPSEGPEFGPCWDAINRDAELVEGHAELTVYASGRPLADTSRLAELAAQCNSRRSSVVQLLGTWCEGEQRTGRTVDGVPRVFWHAWQGWWQRWLAGPDETAIMPSGLVRIDTRDRELAASLIDSLGAGGTAAVWGRVSTSRPAVVVWDGSQLGGVEANRLAIVCRRARQAGSRVVVLLDFPRPETVAAARAIGADAVIGKPFDEKALLAAVATEAEHASRPAAAGQVISPWVAQRTAQAA